MAGRWSFERKRAGNSICGKKADKQTEKTPAGSEKMAGRWSFERKRAGNSICGKKADKRLLAKDGKAKKSSRRAW